MPAKNKPGKTFFPRFHHRFRQARILTAPISAVPFIRLDGFSRGITACIIESEKNAIGKSNMSPGARKKVGRMSE